MQKITFKTLEILDIETITALMQDFYAIDNYPIELETTKNLFHEFIKNENLGRSWLISLDKKIVGYLILTFIFSFEYKGRIAFLDELYIVETYRGKGIGNLTLKFIKEQVRLLNVKMMYLEVEDYNVNAQKLYLANNFEIHNRKILKYKL